MRWVALTAVLALAGCGGPNVDANGFTIDPDFEKRLQQQLLDAKPGSVIELPAGKFALSRSLSLAASGVTVRGKGMDRTILSFAGQTSTQRRQPVQSSTATWIV